ncbi:unnamed protein product [Ectocarpus sp. CCAP 1310/34]|nr:unnamed protein product [Ectocarpus sp. CCAP 1310/34]
MAHGVDLPVSIHQGVHPEHLEKGTAGIIDYFKKQLLSKWLKSTKLLVVCYDRQELVPAIKGHEQLGRTEKLGECSRTFDPKSTDPVPSLQCGSWLRADGVNAEDVGLDGVGSRMALAETVLLLHFRNGTGPIPDVERHRGPDIREAELCVIHFIARAKAYWGKKFDKWVVSSEDTDLWTIILLAMTTGWLTPRGEGTVDLTVHWVVGGETKFLWMNRKFVRICELQDGSESAWPPLTFRSWRPTDADKVLALKSVRTEGLFDKPLFFEDQDGSWAVDIDECAKLLATLFVYNLIRYAILQLPKKKTTATCPSYFALRMQAERGNAIFRYWQNGLRETMPATEFAGKGWGVDPRGKGSNGDELTAGNCVLRLSEYSYIGPDRKTVTLACGCNPEMYLCNRCRCKDRKCSLACGCRGLCTLRWAVPAPVRAGGMSASRPTVDASQTGPIEGVARPQPPIDTRPQPSGLDANAMALFAASMKQHESHGAEQNDEETGTTESPASKGVSSGEAADSENDELEGPESDENSDGSVGALDDLIKLDSDESGSSDGESDVLSEKSVDQAWSDGDTDDGVGISYSTPGTEIWLLLQAGACYVH